MYCERPSIHGKHSVYYVASRSQPGYYYQLCHKQWSSDGLRQSVRCVNRSGCSGEVLEFDSFFADRVAPSIIVFRLFPRDGSSSPWPAAENLDRIPAALLLLGKRYEVYYFTDPKIDNDNK